VKHSQALMNSWSWAHLRSGENAPDFSLDYLDLKEISTLPSVSLYRSSGLAIILAVSHVSLNVIQMP
jgi:hypothetical protein